MIQQHFGWIEIVVSAAIALSFGVWQLVSVSREIARDKAAKEQSGKASGSSAGHSVGEHELDNR